MQGGLNSLGECLHGHPFVIYSSCWVNILDEVLVALADPTRRSILGRLAKGEARVTELAEPFAISLNSVSKHIRVLEQAGLVHRRKSGREYWLSLDRKAVDQAAEWIVELRQKWVSSLDALDEMLRAEDAGLEERNGK